MTRPDDEYPPLDVTSTLHMGSLDEVLEGPTPTSCRAGSPARSRRAWRCWWCAGAQRGRALPARPRRDHQRRHPDSDIFLDDVTVSRRHAEFHRGASAFTVRDVGSLNGTYVNRERVESATLSNGDEVQIGKFRLVFIAGPRLEDVT